MKRTSSHRASGSRSVGPRHLSSNRPSDGRSRSLSSRSDFQERHRTYSSSHIPHKSHSSRPSYYRDGDRHDGGGPFAASFGLSNRDASQMCQLRVSNLSVPLRDQVVKRDLCQVFRKYGDCSVYVVSQRGDLKEAYVTFWSKTEARDARHALSKYKLYDRPLDISVMREPKVFGPGGVGRNSTESREKERREEAWRQDDQRSQSHWPPMPHEEGVPTRTLFVGNLDLDVKLHELRDLFGRFGRVEDVDIKRAPPRAIATYAFVKFAEVVSAQRAKTEMQGSLVGHHRIRLGYGKGTPSNRVYVSGLGEWTTLEWLEGEFDRFGAIRCVDYQAGDDHAIVEFDNMDGAAAAAREMSRADGDTSNEKKILVTFADAMELSVFRDGLRSKQDGDQGRIGENDNSRRHDSESSARGHSAARSVKEDSMQRTRPSGHESRKRSREPSGDDDYREMKKKAVAKIGEKESNLSLADVAQRCALSWLALLNFKGVSFPLRLYLIQGSEAIAEKYLPFPLFPSSDRVKGVPLTQRLRLDRPKLDEIGRRVSAAGLLKHCWLLALPATLPQQSDEMNSAGKNELAYRPLRNLILYLKQKQSAGVAALPARTRDGAPLTDEKTAGTDLLLHAFPPCEFSQEHLKSVCQVDWTSSQGDHLLLLLV